MRILLSAFSCGPGQGSEPGIGWNYALEAARAGHEVWVVTQTEFQREIEAEVAGARLPAGLSFHFFMPRWLALLRDLGLRLGLAGPTWQLTHLIWQCLLPAHLLPLLEGRSFDVVHHITFGGIRHVTRLGRLGIPLVIGPLGGGDSVPMPLRRSFPFAGRLAERLRDWHNLLTLVDPITRRAVDDAVVVYAKTPGSKRALPGGNDAKVVVRTELGARLHRERVVGQTPRPGSIDLMFAGKYLCFKGMHLGLRGIAEAVSRGVDVRLTMVGSGPEEERLRKLADELRIADRITWHGRVPHHDMADLYRRHHALLFPSLREGSGNVVLEAFSYGLPVIAFDNSGPAVVGRPDCALFIAAEGRSEAQCVSDIASAIERLSADAGLLSRMSAASVARSREFEWPHVVTEFYGDVERRLGRRMPGANVPRRAEATG